MNAYGWINTCVCEASEIFRPHPLDKKVVHKIPTKHEKMRFRNIETKLANSKHFSPPSLWGKSKISCPPPFDASEILHLFPTVAPHPMNKKLPFTFELGLSYFQYHNIKHVFTPFPRDDKGSFIIQ